MIELKVKKFHEDAVVPFYANPGDAGMDLTAIKGYWEDATQCWVYDIGLGFEIPEGYVGYIFPRSSVCKYDLDLSNAVGVIDSGYRGEVKFKFKELSRTDLQPHHLYQAGDKIGQLVIMEVPKVKIVVVDELSTSQRGAGGFGSTGA